MQKIWFGLLSFTTAVGAVAIGCAAQSDTLGSGGNGGGDASSATTTTSGMSSSSSASSSASSSPASSSSSGGGCTAPDQCPGADDECKTRSCEKGVCGFTFTEAGTLVTAQMAGDCKKSVCDGKGEIKAVPDDSDRPEDNNVCTANLCSM